MDSIQLAAKVGKGGTLLLSGLPFQDGDVVAVAIALQTPFGEGESHPLAGVPVVYLDPFEPAIPPQDWEAADDHS